MKESCHFMARTLKVSHHSIKFDSDRQCGSGDKIFLICDVMSQHHMSQKPCDFRGLSR